jgi:hypothetical protein
VLILIAPLITTLVIYAKFDVRLPAYSRIVDPLHIASLHLHQTAQVTLPQFLGDPDK